MPSEALVSSTLLELADSLLDDFDAVELLTLLATRCVDLLDVSTAGVMLVAPEGDLRCVASSSEDMRSMELFELQTSEGPCLDSFRLKERIIAETPESLKHRWPRFGSGPSVWLQVGLCLPDAITRAAHRFSEHLPEARTGRCHLRTFLRPRRLPIWHPSRSSISALHSRLNCLNSQLTNALTSRAILEQAKGVLVGRRG